jgi:AcrR family transcriptional regulator
VSEFAFAPGTASPRKRPVQERSQATVTAILDATIRVLADDGMAFTTTRVAEVAGVSVGTLYQYFPNRDALLSGVLAAHLDVAIRALEEAAANVRGLPPRDAADRIVRAIFAAKAAHIEVSRVLHRALGDGLLDDRPVVHAAMMRAREVVAPLLGDPADPATQTRAGVLCAAIEGVVRAAILEDPDRLTDPAWIEQVVALAAGGVTSI